MGKLRDLFFKVDEEEKTKTQYVKMLDGTYPIYSQFGTNIYASDVVQQAIYSIVSEMKKLNPRHVESNGRDIKPIYDTMQNVLDNPNEFMTTSDLLEKITWNLFLNYNSFVFPTYSPTSNGKYVINGLYPIQPKQVEFLEDANGTLFVKFIFDGVKSYTIPYKRVIHFKYRYSVNELMGGNEAGQPDNQALLKTLNINEDLLEGVKKGIKASYSVNAVVKYNTLLDDGTTADNITKLENALKKNESGIMGMDMKGDFIPIERNIKLVDEPTLKFIDDKILRQFGVPLCIVQGDFTKEQYEAFYQKTLEPLIISIGQGFTKSLFTQNQKAIGHKIVLFAKELIFMTTAQKLEAIRLLGDSGAMYQNEIRTIIGLEPLPELNGVRMQSLNYIQTDLATIYQANMVNKKVQGPANDKNGNKDGQV